MSYEESLKEVDLIIGNLESGEVELDKSIKQYEKAVKLIEGCDAMLNSAMGKVKMIVEKDGEVVEKDFV